MPKQTLAEDWLERLISRAQRPFAAAVVISAVTTVIVILAGLAMTIVDKDSFPTAGSGLWWAVQTVTTVGYGDVVPASTAGKLLASLVMLLGIAFISIVTALITTSFINRSRNAARRADTISGAALSEDDLRQINESLDRIDALLAARN